MSPYGRTIPRQDVAIVLDALSAVGPSQRDVAMDSLGPKCSRPIRHGSTEVRQRPCRPSRTFGLFSGYFRVVSNVSGGMNRALTPNCIFPVPDW